VGKVAKNEGIRLKATFLNNIAVGLFVAGVFVPYLALVQTGGFPDVHDMFNNFLSGNISQYRPLGFRCAAIALALFGAALARRGARREIAKLED
jgi:hypothetical protein